MLYHEDYHFDNDDLLSSETSEKFLQNMNTTIFATIDLVCFQP